MLYKKIKVRIEKGGSLKSSIIVHYTYDVWKIIKREMIWYLT